LLLGAAVVAAVAIGATFFAFSGDERTATGDSIQTSTLTDASTTSTVEPAADLDPDPDGAPDGEAQGDGGTESVTVADVQPGDCLIVDLSLGMIGETERVDCEQPHSAEVIARHAPSPSVVDGAGGDPDTYPGRAALLADASSECFGSLLDYIGFTGFVTTLTFRAVPPTFAEWDDGTRRDSVCLGYQWTDEPLTGSLAGRGSSYAASEGTEIPVKQLFGGMCFDLDEGTSVGQIGKRQQVRLRACANAHRFEVFSVEALPLEPDEVDLQAATQPLLDLLTERADRVCADAWSRLTVAEGLADAELFSMVPDEVDWQLGDRIAVCIAAWERPVVSSVVMASAMADNDG
jgi:hypothetical protein